MSKTKISEQLVIPPNIRGYLTHNQWNALQASWSKSFVTPFITKKLADELSLVVPQLKRTIDSNIRDLDRLADEYGLAFAFLDRCEATQGPLAALNRLMLAVSEELSLFTNSGDNQNILKILRGSTKGNRAQIEFNQFLYEVSEILKTQRGIPWDDVADIIHAQAAADSRIRNYFGDKKSEFTKEAMRRRYVRHQKYLQRTKAHNELQTYGL